MTLVQSGDITKPKETTTRNIEVNDGDVVTYSDFSGSYKANTEKVAFLVPENATEMAFKSVQPATGTQWIVIGYDDATQNATIVGLGKMPNVANVTFTKAGANLVVADTTKQNAATMRTQHNEHTYVQGGKYKVVKNGNLVDFYFHNNTGYIKWFSIDTSKTATISDSQTLKPIAPVRFGMLGGISTEASQTLLEEVQILK